MSEARITETPATRAGWRAGYLLAAFGIYMVDQVSKAWAVEWLRSGQDIPLIRGFLDLVYTGESRHCLWSIAGGWLPRTLVFRGTGRRSGGGRALLLSADGAERRSSPGGVRPAVGGYYWKSY